MHNSELFPGWQPRPGAAHEGSSLRASVPLEGSLRRGGPENSCFARSRTMHCNIQTRLEEARSQQEMHDARPSLSTRPTSQDEHDFDNATSILYHTNNYAPSSIGRVWRDQVQAMRTYDLYTNLHSCRANLNAFESKGKVESGRRWGVLHGRKVPTAVPSPPPRRARGWGRSKPCQLLPPCGGVVTRG